MNIAALYAGRATALALSCLLCGLAWADPSLTALARSILGANQGVYVEAADGTILLSQAAAQPVHPASVSKVPTTLALLQKFGPEHCFTTSFSAEGSIKGGQLMGDLWVQSDGDPYFVDENALLVARRLNELGVYRIEGTLRPSSPLIFDWQPDNDASRLRRALSGDTSNTARENLRALETTPTTGSPRIQFDGVVTTGTLAVAGPGSRTLVWHRSQPLVPLAKALNDFSNNIFKPLADAAGGASAVENLARHSVPSAMRAEITLGDGAGTDARNRLSPRAAVKLLRALEVELSRTGHTLVDILPLAGVDAGTLHDRLNAPDEIGRVVGKTGTFGDYGASALIGAIPTLNLGTVYFAILNHGVPIPEARRRQNRFVHELLLSLRSTRWSYTRDTRPAIALATATTVPTTVAAPLGGP